MCKKLHGIVLFIICLVNINVKAQQNAQFSHFMFTKQYYNPAFAGIEPYTKALLIHRTQWLGYEPINVDDEGGSPITQNLSLTHPLRFGTKFVKSGIGLDLVNDKLGPNKNFALRLNYSHHLELTKLGGVLALGVRAGFWNWKLDAAQLRPIEQNDMLIDALGGGAVSQLRPDFGAGLWFQNALDKYYIGVSVDHLIPSGFDFGIDPSLINTEVSQHLFLTGGYNASISNNIQLKPSALIQTDFSETTFKLAALGVYDTKVKHEFWAGVSFRQSLADKSITPENTSPKGKTYSLDDFILIVGFGTLKDQVYSVSRLQFSYAIDIVSSGRSAKNATSHEIMLAYILPSKLITGPPPLKTPRYQHPK